MSRIGRPIALLAALAAFSAIPAAAATGDLSVGVLWPERQRSFLQDGPGFLLTAAQVEELAALAEIGRGAWIDDFLARDPDPATPANELAEGVRRRRALIERELVSPRDVRAQLLFLHGEPQERERIDCLTTFKPLEIWTYERDASPIHLVLYRPASTLPFKLWSPWDSKAILYTSEMEYYLRQWDELRSRIRPGVKRFDRQLCRRAPWVDRVTGFDGVTRPLDEAPDPRVLRSFLDPPGDLGTWAARAVTTPMPPAPETRLEVSDIEFLFPERDGQRMRTRIRLTLPPDSPLAVAEPGTPEEPAEAEDSDNNGRDPQTVRLPGGGRAEVGGRGEVAQREAESAADAPVLTSDRPELRIAIDGVIEHGDDVYDEFRVRFRIPAEQQRGEDPIALLLDQKLRPDSDFVLRLRLRDEVGGATGYLARGFHVPRLARQQDAERDVAMSVGSIVEDVEQQRLEGVDSLYLVPPGDEVILTLWRAEALVSGSRIEKVVFLVNGQRQLTRTRPPFTAELGLGTYPEEIVVRAEGYDAEGDLVDADEVVLNQPRGTFRVAIREPPRGRPVVMAQGELPVSAEIVVPDGRRVERVEFRINDEIQETLTAPPWEARLTVPATAELSYLSVVAVLDDGRQREDVRILNAPVFMEEVDVELVELYTTVTDRSGRPVRGLPESAFRVFEEGREQRIAQFEEVENLPLTLGLAIDVSGSMGTALPVAVDAARGFLDAILTSQDTCFLLSFSDRVRLEMAPTDDPVALERGLSALAPEGWTTLYDAAVAGLYYFRGNRGRRVLVLLTDGEDTASRYDFDQTLEYARKTGVAIYTIGIEQTGPLRRARAQNRLQTLARETGGRFFAIRSANELAAVYQEIEEELRSQYLIAYASDAQGGEERFREVEVQVDGGEARTIRGYYR
ncbi:MAG: VWA domain-containing protein [Thermoanaerobaculia bacterium]